MEPYKQNILALKAIRRFRNPAVLLFSITLLCLVFIDLVILAARLDIASVKKTLYTVEGDYEYLDDAQLYRDSKNIERLYELIPGAKADFDGRRSEDIDKGNISFSIDRFGFRSNGGVEREKQKPSGVFRIMAVGESNTFGPLVSDSQTWPAQLEKVLNEKMPGRFEVWNAGLNAYNMTQKVVYVRRLIKEYDPDLLLFQQNNTGRRAFFYQAEFSYFFRNNKQLWCENVPLICCNFKTDAKWHQWLVCHWALYRLGISIYNNFLIFSSSGRDIRDILFAMPENYFPSFADKLAVSLFFDFIGDCQKKGRPRTAMIVNRREEQDKFFVPGLPLFFINTTAQEANRPEEYSDIHPPSQVYEWYGEKIADWLILEGLVPGQMTEYRK